MLVLSSVSMVCNSKTKKKETCIDVTNIILHLPVHPRFWKSVTYHVLTFKRIPEVAPIVVSVYEQVISLASNTMKCG